MKEIANKIQELIKINVNDKGDKIVSARELYIGLGLNKAVWSRWYKKNIIKNEFFEYGKDYVGVQHNVEGNEVQDFGISIEFAKHIAMMARTEKSHLYRNYFIQCEKQVKKVPKLSPMDLLKLQVKALEEQKQEIVEVKEDVKDLRENSPLYNIECDELQKIVKAKGTKVLGGRNSIAYKNKSIRAKVYSDIQREIKRQFSVRSYKAIRRKDLSIAKEIVKVYKLPFILSNEISEVNELDSYELNEM